MPDKPPRVNIPGSGALTAWREKLRADRTPGWRLRGALSSVTMHYFATLPDGSFNTICGTAEGRALRKRGAGVPLKPEKWLYPAKKFPYLARKRYPCDKCLVLAPVKPPKFARARPTPKLKKVT